MHNTFQGHSGKEPEACGKEHERSMDMLIGCRIEQSLKIAAAMQLKESYISCFSWKRARAMVTNLMNRRKPMTLTFS